MKKKEGQKPVLVNSSHLAVQANRFIEARYKESLSFWESFLITKMCSMISPDDVDFKPYKIYIKEVIDYMELTPSGHVYNYIMEAAKRLLDRKIVIGAVDEKGRKEIIETHIVTSVRRLLEPQQDEGMYVTLTFLPELKPYLLQLHRDFTKLDMEIFKKLKTASSIRLYQIFKSHMGKNQYRVRFELEELKEILGVSEKYQQYAGFKMRVLDEAQQRLTEKTDIGFTYEEIKTGKKVSALVFHTFNNAKQKELPQAQNIAQNLTSSDEAQENLILELTPIVVRKFGVSLKIFMALVESHTEGAVRKAVQVTEKASASGKVANAAGFFVEALRGGYEDKDALKKQADLKKNTEKADKQTKLEASNKAKQLDEDVKKAKLRQENERKTQIVKSLLSQNSELLYRAVEQLKSGMFGRTYNADLSIEQNLANPMLMGGLMNILQKLEPQVFD